MTGSKAYILNRIKNATLNLSNMAYVNYILFNSFVCQTLTFTVHEIQYRYEMVHASVNTTDNYPIFKSHNKWHNCCIFLWMRRIEYWI